MWANIKKVILSLSLIVLFALYALQKQAQPGAAVLNVAALIPTSTIVAGEMPSATAIATARANTTTVAAVVPPSSTVSTLAPTSQALPSGVNAAPSSVNPAPTDASLARVAPVQTATQPPAPTATATASGQYKDGTYTGSQADAHWGTVQVVAVVSGGQLSDVQFAVYPNHRSRSQDINSQAMPILTQEAIQAQQANVDLVSGATDTSQAFIQSLSDALSQAQ